MMDNNLSEETKKVLQAKKEIIERLIEAEVEEILPQRYAKKREGKETPLICPNCGVRKANQIRRDGHYRRKLRVAEGVIEDLHIPRIECMDCGRYLKLDFKISDPKRRYLVGEGYR
jgi:transposase